MDELKQLLFWLFAVLSGGLAFFAQRLIMKFDKRLDAHELQLMEKVSKSEFAEYKSDNAKHIDSIKSDLSNRLDRMETNIIDIIKSRTGGK